MGLPRSLKGRVIFTLGLVAATLVVAVPLGVPPGVWMAVMATPAVFLGAWCGNGRTRRDP